MSRILFITGTDTGVGKTVLTALLTLYLRRRGVRVLAMKPFCSGDTEDVDRILQVQRPGIPRAFVNPFFFHEALAPMVAARRAGRSVPLWQAMDAIAAMQSRCDVLVVEGAGGVLAPLGEGFSAPDLIRQLGAEVQVVAPNKLGVINQVRLAVEALWARQVRDVGVVLMGQSENDGSVETNKNVLRELIAPVEVLEIGNMGPNSGEMEALAAGSKIFEKVLARITSPDSFCVRSSRRMEGRQRSEGRDGTAEKAKRGKRKMSAAAKKR